MVIVVAALDARLASQITTTRNRYKFSWGKLEVKVKVLLPQPTRRLLRCRLVIMGAEFSSPCVLPLDLAI